ncbi:hypothetical protein C7271_03295 [filamentous cyanobacterium CCP5]|nr:hypothetical protein C7271_03295 [filamentous cyanobacterium CCP5]
MITGIIAAFTYGALAIAGGLIGYFQARSLVSLVSGTLSGGLLLLGGWLWSQGNPAGAGLAIGVTAALVVVFIRRWMQTQKAMPALAMIATGSLAFVAMLLAIV